MEVFACTLSETEEPERSLRSFVLDNVIANIHAEEQKKERAKRLRAREQLNSENILVDGARQR